MRCYRIKVDGVWREIDLRPLSEVPSVVVTESNSQNMLWDVFGWGMVKPEQVSVLDHAPIRLIRKLFQDWEEDSRITLGEIRGLIELIGKHPDPLEMDLIDKGLRLRDCPSAGFNWRDLKLIVEYLGPDSKLVAETQPDNAHWDKHAYLLADIVDGINWLCWSKTEDAHKRNGNPPDPVPRPGVKKKGRAGFNTKPIPMQRARELAGIDPSRKDTDRSKKIAAAFKS
jgi:Family of unknown function (DUF5361)